MRITKFGHSCFLVEEQGARILLDPGSYSVIPEIGNIDAILITHEHQDHCDFGALKKIIAENPEVQILSNVDVVQKLTAEGMNAQILSDGEMIMVNGVQIEGFGIDHAIIHPEFPRAKNTGYMIAGRLYHPGDALYVPPKPIEILAIPVVAPWSKISETIDYLQAVKPRVVFPIHDGFLNPNIPGLFNRLVSSFAEKQNTEWIAVENGKVIEV